MKTYCAESAAKVKISTEPAMQKLLFQEKRNVSGVGGANNIEENREVSDAKIKIIPEPGGAKTLPQTV